MTNTVLRIVGTATCPVGSLRADNDGDSLRSNLLSDGRVYNIFNGFSHPSRITAIESTPSRSPSATSSPP